VACEDCGEPDTNARLDGVDVCDRCFDRRISAVTGLPRLPDPPPPVVIVGPDGRQHHLRYRVWRAGVGIEVQLDETGVPVGEGYQFAVLGDNDADVDALVAVKPAELDWWTWSKSPSRLYLGTAGRVSPFAGSCRSATALTSNSEQSLRN
jgi:hypothetical protein